MKFKNFKDNEIKGLNIQFVMLLDMARDEAKIPFVITSGLRTPDENKNAGGVQDSAHLRGLAVDIRCRDPHERFLIVNALLKQGFNRIGNYTTHIHVDLDASLPQNVMWLD